MYIPLLIFVSIVSCKCEVLIGPDSLGKFACKHNKKEVVEGKVYKRTFAKPAFVAQIFQSKMKLMVRDL